MRLLQFTLLAVIITAMYSCTQNRCTCTDGYVKDVKHASQKVAAQACEDIEQDRQIIKSTTKCDLQ